MVQVLNNYSETLSGAVTSSATTFTVSNAPTGLTVTADNPLTLTLDDETNIEVVRVTAISGNDLTVVRGYEGTAQAWSDGALIECRLTNLTLTEMSSDSGITESMAMTSVVPAGPHTYLWGAVVTEATLGVSGVIRGVTKISADLYIVLDDSGKIIHTDASGQPTQDAITLGSPGATVSWDEVAFDGTNLWLLSSATTLKVFKYALDGTYLNVSHVINSDTHPEGLTWDGTHLWVVADNIMRQLDLTTGLTGTTVAHSETVIQSAFYANGMVHIFTGGARLVKSIDGSGTSTLVYTLPAAPTTSTTLSAVPKDPSDLIGSYFVGGTAGVATTSPEVESTLNATGIKHLAAVGDTVTGSGGESSVVVTTPTDDSITVNGIWADGTLTRPRIDNDHIQRQGGLNVWRS